MMEEQQVSSQNSYTPHGLNDEETRLWRTALLFLVLLATGLTALLWEGLQPYHL